MRIVCTERIRSFFFIMFRDLPPRAEVNVVGRSFVRESKDRLCKEREGDRGTLSLMQRPACVKERKVFNFLRERYTGLQKEEGYEL